MGGDKENDRVASPESVSIQLNTRMRLKAANGMAKSVDQDRIFSGAVWSQSLLFHRYLCLNIIFSVISDHIVKIKGKLKHTKNAK